MVRNTRMKRSRRFKNKNSKRRNKKTRRGGNGIGANCNEPNFSIYNTNMLKLFPYKGGNLDINDQYKNNDGSQF
jgi:hypothetical protein